MSHLSIGVITIFVTVGACSIALADPAAKRRLAATPPMGWNSWEAFRKNLDEEAIKTQADAMVRLGLRDAGYTYIVIDGGWKTSLPSWRGELVFTL